ncbi:MAG TPA: hypothetical protein VMR31_05845 [Myxococcota bacterium]|nr:hypothetical protein [Myxococcota bacterium]
MTYSMVTMRDSLKRLGVTKGVNPFVWEDAELGKKGVVNPALAAKFGPYAPNKNFLNDLLEYCWLAYSKALKASGPQLIGRQGDLWVPQYLAKAGVDPKSHEKLWADHAKGNVQVLDKWAPVVNDCWVLGGVHRRADFNVVSILALKNLWDFGAGFHVVTAREILGLLHFGYSLERQAGKLRLVCADSAAAQSATIEAYDRLMRESKGRESIRALIDPAFLELNAEIASFDKSKLKHVTPPK